MPIGKEVASFSMKSTSLTKGIDSAGNHTFVINLEGTVTGGWSGTVLSTMTVTTPDMKSGTYSTCAAAYLADGSVLTGNGNGVFHALGGHKWRLNSVDLISDGTRLAAESEMSLADRSLNGKLFPIE